MVAASEVEPGGDAAALLRIALSIAEKKGAMLHSPPIAKVPINALDELMLQPASPEVATPAPTPTLTKKKSSSVFEYFQEEAEEDEWQRAKFRTGPM